MTKPDETTAGTKLVLPNGQRISLGVQSGSLAMLLWIGWGAKDIYAGVMEEAERTREAVTTLGARLDKMDAAITSLADNAKRVEAVEAEAVKLRETQARLELEIAAALACAKDRKRCP